MSVSRAHAGSLSALLLCLFLAGCASGPATMQYEYAGDERFRWPAAPDPARYALVGQLTGEQNFSTSGSSFGSRMLGWIVGLGSAKRTPVVLQRPQNGFVGTDGRIYVTDVSRGAVFVFDETQGRLLLWQAAGATARFMTPVGIAPGGNGEILVADADLKIVVRLDAGGERAAASGWVICSVRSGLCAMPRVAAFSSPMRRRTISRFSAMPANCSGIIARRSCG